MFEKFIEIKVNENSDFLVIKETLTRIGIPKNEENILWQSCHILHYHGKLYIVHFKELFALDGKETNYNLSDEARRNTIANLLQEWGLLTILNPEICEEPRTPLSHIKIIPYKDKDQWTLNTKYTIKAKHKG